MSKTRIAVLLTVLLIAAVGVIIRYGENPGIQEVEYPKDIPKEDKKGRLLIPSDPPVPFANDLVSQPGVTNWSGMLKERNVYVMIHDSKSLDLPQVELRFKTMKNGNVTPAQVLDVRIQSPAGADHKYYSSIALSRTRPVGLRLGVARDAEEEKFPDLLRKGKTYEVRVRYPTLDDCTHKRITIPEKLEEKLVYPLPILLDRSEFITKPNTTSIRGAVAVPSNVMNDARLTASYYQQDGELFRTKLSESGEFQFNVMKLGGWLSLQVFNKECGYVLALARNVSKGNLNEQDFDWRAYPKEFKRYTWSFTAQVDKVEMVGLKLKDEDMRPVFWKKVSGFGAGQKSSINFDCMGGSYQFIGLIRIEGESITLNLGDVELKDGNATFRSRSKQAVVEQKERMILENRSRTQEKERIQAMKKDLSGK